jgi:polyhydroxyalkanoate synthesis regulator phasin
MSEVKYKLKSNNILKDGHTMFLNDVVKDLKRKSYLESENASLKKQVAHMQEDNKTIVGAMLSLEDAKAEIELLKKQIALLEKNVIVWHKVEDGYPPKAAMNSDWYLWSNKYGNTYILDEKGNDDTMHSICDLIAWCELPKYEATK